MKPLIKLSHVSKYYKTKTGVAEGMKDVSLEFFNNEFAAVVGESGSGKTTLLNVISGLDSYEDGELYYNGKETSHFSVRDFEKFRAKNIAFVFQSYNIVESYSVLDNVKIALIAQDYPKDKIHSRALELVDKVGLSTHKNQKAIKLSGGQQQRVVIARALAKDSPIILADEPTGNLDEKSSDEILTLLKEISKDKLVILVSHNLKEVEKFATRKIVMHDGNVKNDITLENTEIKEGLLVEDKAKSSNARKGFNLALKNTLAMPKRTIFSLILFSVIFFAFIYFYSSVVINTIDKLSFYDDSIYEVVLVRRDDNKFDKTSFNNIPAKRNTKKYFNIPFLSFEEVELINLGYNEPRAIYYNFYLNNLESIPDKTKLKGRLPVHNYEVVVSNGHYLLNDIYKLGDKIKLNDHEFIIVGLFAEPSRSYNGMELYISQDLIFNENLEILETAKDLLIDENSLFNEVIVSSNTRRDNNLFKRKIDDNYYQLIDQDLVYEHEMRTLTSLLRFLLWMVMLLVLQIIFLVVYQVQRNMMNNRKKDFSVYRSIGINEQQVSSMILFEQAIYSLVSSLFIILVLNLLGLRIDYFYNLTKNITIFNYFLVIFVFTFFTLRLGRKFNKRIFDVTVIEALKEDY